MMMGMELIAVIVGIVTLLGAMLVHSAVDPRQLEHLDGKIKYIGLAALKKVAHTLSSLTKYILLKTSMLAKFTTPV